MTLYEDIKALLTVPKGVMRICHRPEGWPKDRMPKDFIIAIFGGAPSF